MPSKVWLITGASRGLGYDLAKVALEAGHTVIACRRSSSKEDSSVSELQQLGATWVDLDVAAANVESKIKDIATEHGRIDVLVNNAGYGLGGALEDTSVEQVNALFAVNFLGPLRTTQALIPSMRAQGGGTVVNIGSANGISPLPGLGIYSASKFALEALSETFQAELAPFNIRVLMVEPGALATRFTDPEQAAVLAPVSDIYKGTAVDQVLNAVADVPAYMSQSGSPEKAARRIVEAVDGTGMLAGKELGLRLPLGTAGERMREKGKQFTETAERFKDVYESI